MPETHVSSLPTARRARGFTLIELLTVIAIIGILAAILIPTISRVREMARFSKGTSNLRELARANVLFAQDNKGWIPHEGNPTVNPSPSDSYKVGPGIGCWWNEIPPYIGAKTLAVLNDLRPSQLPTIDSSYVLVCPNAAATSKYPTQLPWLCYGPPSEQSSTSRLTNLNRVKDTSRTVLLAELTNHSPGQVDSTMYGNANPSKLGDATVNNTRWKTKALVSFFDGHVRSYSRAELLAQGSDLEGKNNGGPIWSDPASQVNNLPGR